MRSLCIVLVALLVLLAVGCKNPFVRPTPGTEPAVVPPLAPPAKPTPPGEQTTRTGLTWLALVAAGLASVAGATAAAALFAGQGTLAKALGAAAGALAVAFGVLIAFEGFYVWIRWGGLAIILAGAATVVWLVIRESLKRGDAEKAVREVVVGLDAFKDRLDVVLDRVKDKPAEVKDAILGLFATAQGVAQDKTTKAAVDQAQGKT